MDFTEFPALPLKFPGDFPELLSLWTFRPLLEKPRPLRGVFGPFEVHLGVSKRVSPKVGVCVWKCLEKCPWGPSDTFLDTFAPGLKGSLEHSLRHSQTHPASRDTLSGASSGTSGPKGPKTLGGGRVFLKLGGHFGPPKKKLI